MSKKTFQIGDTVRLKAGGPAMSVSQVTLALGEDSKSVECTWFAGKKQESGWFDPRTLVLVEDDDDGATGT